VQSALGAVVHIDRDEEPVALLDWLPWHHTFGGNQNFNRTLYYAGTLYIDDGKPLPGFFQEALRNLKEVKVTTFSTVPAAYPFVLDALEKDPELRANVFSKLRWFSYGGSDMPQKIYDRIQAISIKQTGMRYPVITALGSTETSAIVTAIHWTNEKMGNIGLPVPGTTLKLVPLGNKYELRVKGPQVIAEYFNAPELTAESFDEDGFLLTGDAVSWVDPEHPEEGLRFSGRVAEDFKLLNGTWVQTGGLRSKLVSALSPLVSDLVVCGHDKSYISIMAWPNEPGIRALLNDQSTPLEELVNGEPYRHYFKERLEQFNTAHDHASSRVKRVLMLDEPPSLDENEITDKRYINQRRVLERRNDQVIRLYAEMPDNIVMCL